MVILKLIYVAIFVIFTLVVIAIMQIRMSGMKVKDFWGFIQANELLDRLYAFSKRCDALTPQEQVIFLGEAEKVFNAFDKVPNALWEEEYQKYSIVLDKYKDIRVKRWVSN